MERPLITVEPDGNVFRLMVTSHGRTVPAGPRILRANPPYIVFAHPDRAVAERDAQTLREYFSSLDTTKPSKAQARKHAANDQ